MTRDQHRIDRLKNKIKNFKILNFKNKIFDSILGIVNEYVVNICKIENVKLEPIVQEFPNPYVQCREKPTHKKYQSYFNSSLEWSLTVLIQVLPVKQFDVALYLLYLIQQNSSFLVMELSFYTISFYHLFYHLCKSKVVRNMLEAVKTIKHHKMRKKKAVEQITKIYDHCMKTEPNIYNMRTFTTLQRGIKYKGIRHRFSTFICEYFY